MDLKWKDIKGRVMDEAKEKADFIFAMSKMKIWGDALVTPKGSFVPTDHALTQLSNKLNIPARYMHKCREEAPQMYADNINYWLKHKDPDDFLLRTQNGTLRAVLSDRYSKLDNDMIVNTFDPKGITFKDFHCTDHYFNLRGIFNQSLNVTKNDPIFLGFNIMNSEVGLKRLVVDICIWRQVCSNGLIIQEAGENLMRQRHLWVKTETLEERFKIACKFIQENGMQYLQAFKDAKNKEIPGDDPEVTIRRTLANFPQEFVENVWEDIQEDNLYELVNVITNRAKELPIDLRVEAETVAGKLVA